LDEPKEPVLQTIPFVFAKAIMLALDEKVKEGKDYISEN